MIHKMDDAKKKPDRHGQGGLIKAADMKIRDSHNLDGHAARRQEVSCKTEMTEEELLRLIGQVEMEEMLHAPKHLKDNIFAQIRKERRIAKKRQVFVYRAKVFVAMAAALAVLILMPVQNRVDVRGVPVQEREEDRILEQMALRRQKNRDSDWEQYLEGQKRGSVRGFLEDLNEKMNQLGADVYNNITT